jgi:hypothetical protein
MRLKWFSFLLQGIGKIYFQPKWPTNYERVLLFHRFARHFGSMSWSRASVSFEIALIDRKSPPICAGTIRFNKSDPLYLR